MNMRIASERYCARGEQCRLYHAETGKPQRLGRYHKGDICDQCSKADSDADFEAHQRLPRVLYEDVMVTKNPLRGQHVLWRRNAVAQMLAQRGSFWDAIRDVRARWGLDHVPTQLPPESDITPHPPSIPDQEPPRPMEHILPPEVPNADLGEPGDPERYEFWENAWYRWKSDLADVLRACLPEKCLGESRRLYFSSLPPLELIVPWYLFAAACVCYDPPPEEALQFADYGDELLRLGQQGTAGTLTSAVMTEQELRQRAIDLIVEHQVDNWISEKAWELKSELDGLDFTEATREILRRFPKVIAAERDRLRAELYEWEMKRNPPYRYYLEFDPAETTNKEMLNLLPAIRALEGSAQKAGRKPQDNLLPVMCDILLEKPEWSPELLADQLGMSAKRVGELAREGKALF